MVRIIYTCYVDRHYCNKVAWFNDFEILSFFWDTFIVICTDLSGKELHKLVGVGIVMTSGNLLCNGSTLAPNARYMGPCPTLSTIFPIVISRMTLVAITMILPVQAWLLKLPCAYNICKAIACMCNRKQVKTYFSRGMSIVVCSDLWGKELPAYTSGCEYTGEVREPMWCNGSTLAQNARDMGSIPALGKVFPICITPTTPILN